MVAAGIRSHSAPAGAVAGAEPRPHFCVFLLKVALRGRQIERAGAPGEGHYGIEVGGLEVM